MSGPDVDFLQAKVNSILQKILRFPKLGQSNCPLFGLSHVSFGLPNLFSQNLKKKKKKKKKK